MDSFFRMFCNDFKLSKKIVFFKFYFDDTLKVFAFQTITM